MNLHPFYHCLAKADELIGQGATIHQEFLCSHCGTKQIMETPNTFYLTGKCEECGKITDIEKDGCNYAVIFTPKVKEGS